MWPKNFEKLHQKAVIVNRLKRTVHRPVDRLAVTSRSLSRTLSFSGSRLAANFRLINEYSCPAINICGS